MHTKRLLPICVLFVTGLAGCRTSLPPTDVQYDTQQNLVQNAIVRLESSPAKGDRELLRLLKQLETEIGEAERRHTEDKKRIEQLQEEVENLRQAAGFSVHHIEILYFTRVTEEGIDLWVTPFDRRNDVVKTAGSFNIALHEPAAWSLASLGKKLYAWHFSSKDVETRWEGQLFEGYHLKLGWPDGKVPDAQTAVLRVSFITAEGKLFSATKELTIRE